MMGIVDTHQHLWDLSRFKLGWLEPGLGPPLEASFTPRDYEEATRGLNVVKAVYMEVDVVPEQQQAEADAIVELCGSGTSPTCAAVVSGRPASDGFAKYAQQFRNHKSVKGIRQVLHVDGTPRGYCLRSEFVKGMQVLGEFGLSFDLCVRPGELNDFEKLVAQCPGTRFILDHCGNPNRNFTATDTENWQRGLANLAARNNVICKISGIVANGFEKGKWSANDLAPFVNFTLDAFGPDRVMFGGDWPVCLVAGTYNDWLSALQTIVRDRPAIEQRKLFSDNAVKCYGLA